MIAPPPPQSAAHPPLRLGRRALALAPGVLAVRGLAFLVPIAVTWTFGAGIVSDAWFAGLAVPTAVVVVVLNATSLVGPPALGGRPLHFRSELVRIVRTSLGWTLAAGAVALVAFFGLCQSMPGLDPDFAFRAPTLAAALFPWMGVVAITSALRSACEVRGLFYASTLAPLARATVTLTLVLGSGARLAGLPIAWTLGALAELVVLRWALGPLPPDLAADAPPLVPLGPVLLGESMVAGNLLVDRAFAATLGPGTLTVLDVADRVRLIPQILIESTFFPVSFATWSTLAATDSAQLPRAVGVGLRQVAGVAAPVLAGLWIGRRPIVGLLARGAFTPADAEAAAAILAGYLPGLWALAIAALALRANVLAGRSQAVAWIGAWSFAANLLGNALLAPWLGAPGLAVATSVVSFSVAGWHLFLLRRTLAAARPSAWLAVLAISGASAALSAVVGAPRSFGDPALWLGWSVAGGLLALALLRTRTDR